MNINIHTNKRYTGKLDTQNAKSYSITALPKHGTLTLNKNSGRFIYTPNRNFVGRDSFKYKAINSRNSKIATVKITVTNKAPVVYDTSFDVVHDRTYKSVFNVTDSDGDKLTYRIIDKVQGDFDIIIFKEGSFTTLPNSGPLVFHYVANDGISDSNIATARS